MRQPLLRHQRQPGLSKTGVASNARWSFLIPMKANLFVSLVAAAGALALSQAIFAERVPETPTKPVTTEYHGVTVEDPYQWLENDEDSQVKAWSDAQNQRARKYLDSLPDRN